MLKKYHAKIYTDESNAKCMAEQKVEWKKHLYNVSVAYKTLKYAFLR